MQTQRTNQGGSVATFVLVGIILVAILIGSIYLVNIRGQQARKSQEIASSETQKVTSSIGTTTDNSQNSSSETEKAESTSSTEVNTSTKTTPSENLPQTGIEPSLSQLCGVFLLTVFSAAYILSRKNLDRSL